MRFADGYQAIPEILLAIVVVAVFGGSVTVLILVLGFAGWESYTRVAFNLTRSLRERPFVEAAVASGAGGRYVMWRHILPQMSPVLTVIATLQVGQLILQETALSFLGLGLPPPTATWGNILAEGRDRLLVAPWIANLAGIAIVLLGAGHQPAGQWPARNARSATRGSAMTKDKRVRECTTRAGSCLLQDLSRC